MAAHIEQGTGERMTPAEQPDDAQDQGDAARAERLKDLDAKLSALRERRAPPKPPRGGGRWAGHELAWRMVIDLVAGIAVGGAMGYGLDVLLGTAPLFLIVLVLLGFASGVRVMMQSAADHQARLKAREAAADAARNDNGAPAGAPDTTTGATAPRNEGL